MNRQIDDHVRRRSEPAEAFSAHQVHRRQPDRYADQCQQDGRRQTEAISQWRGERDRDQQSSDQQQNDLQIHVFERLRAGAITPFLQARDKPEQSNPFLTSLLGKLCTGCCAEVTDRSDHEDWVQRSGIEGRMAP
ncbi:hypothetical protein, partial [Candidatus Binatus sp.]|uniref:hypothetical protein n=1 Tax=Candidatus Binatus sp. TaxID=2811406 RepID=UPI003D0EA5FE